MCIDRCVEDLQAQRARALFTDEPVGIIVGIGEYSPVIVPNPRPIARGVVGVGKLIEQL